MNDERYLDELSQARAAKTQPAPMPEKPKVSFPWFYFILGLANDLLDYLAIGSIPIAGDVIDLFVSAIRWYGKQIRKQRAPNMNLAIATIIEFIPGGDFVPSYTAEVLITYVQEKAAAQKEYEEMIAAVQEKAAAEREYSEAIAA